MSDNRREIGRVGRSTPKGAEYDRSVLAAMAEIFEIKLREEEDNKTIVEIIQLSAKLLKKDHKSLTRELAAIKRNRGATIRQVNVLLEAISEAVEYKPGRHHNNPPPPLRVSDDPKYIAELSKMVIELKRLNSLLERKAIGSKDVQKTVVDFGKHFDTFMQTFAPLMGKGIAGLTIAAGAGLLLHAGVPEASIGAAWGLLKSGK